LKLFEIEIGNALKCFKCEGSFVDTLPFCSSDPANPGKVELCESNHDSCYLKKGSSGQYTTVYAGCAKKPSGDEECITDHLKNSEKCFCTRDFCNSGIDPTTIIDSAYEETNTITSVVIVVAVAIALLVIIALGVLCYCKNRTPTNSRI